MFYIGKPGIHGYRLCDAIGKLLQMLYDSPAVQNFTLVQYLPINFILDKTNTWHSCFLFEKKGVWIWKFGEIRMPSAFVPFWSSVNGGNFVYEVSLRLMVPYFTFSSRVGVTKAVLVHFSLILQKYWLDLLVTSVKYKCDISIGDQCFYNSKKKNYK